MRRRRGILRASTLAALGAMLASILAVARTASAAAPSYPADEIEAAFLYRFAGFVAWPPGALKAPVFTVAVLGDDAVARDLARMLPHGELKGRQVRIRRITGIDELGDARILFIGPCDPSILRRRLARIAGHPVLVVTRQPGGLDEGAMINFLLIRRHVRFEISLPAARRGGLDISAELLSVATRIEGRPVGSEAGCESSPPQSRPGASCSSRVASR